ncbi:MAG: hypothetical protein EOP10_14140 [Proteobacteria bacterium]|nr:MAG: hypothetical protein EOP10_14140 [Pseudomonadota bacterium]
MWESLKLIVQVAFRNLWLYRLKTLVIAGLLTMGSFIGVVGLSLLTDVERSMQDSIISSVAGHLQVYSKKAKDELALFGGTFMGRAEIGTMPDIVPFRDVIKSHPNVADFIPMGSDMAILGRGNELDDLIGALRDALKKGDQAIIQQRKEDLSFLMQQLVKEVSELEKLSADKEMTNRYKTDLATAMAPEFLSSLSRCSISCIWERTLNCSKRISLSSK